jgi:hypothetical protein
MLLQYRREARVQRVVQRQVSTRIHKAHYQPPCATAVDAQHGTLTR